jgi:hypothetical protein
MSGHVARRHARFSPSGSKRVMECPGSLRMQEHIPDRRSSFADEGTAAHELAERCAREGIRAEDLADFYVNLDAPEAQRVTIAPVGGRSFLVDSEMVDGVQLYLDTCAGVLAAASPQVEHSYETWVDLSGVSGMEGGTADFMAYDPATQKVVVADLKYGRGVAVEPSENTQLLCYALGVVNRYHNRGVGDIELIVVQPRCGHKDGPVRRWVADAVTLLDFEVDLARAAEASEAPDAPLRAGDWCKFCKAEAICPAKRDRVLDIVKAEFGVYDEKPTLPIVTAMSPDEIARVLRLRTEITSWLARIDEFAHAEAAQGRFPTGYKLVARRATREWRNEQEAAQALQARGLTDIWTEPELLSPAKIEKLMPGRNKAERAKALADLTVKKSSGTVLAPDDDPRPSVIADASEFATSNESDPDVV